MTDPAPITAAHRTTAQECRTAAAINNNNCGSMYGGGTDGSRKRKIKIQPDADIRKITIVSDVKC